MTETRKILFIQYGDFAEAFDRLREGGAETYRDQRKSVDYVAGLPETSIILILSCSHEQRQLTSTLSALGVPAHELTQKRVEALLDQYAPDLIILRTPQIAVLKAAARRKIPLMPCFADIFEAGGFRRRMGNWQLRRLLASDNVRCVANHNLNASKSVANVLGVSDDRIIPWDWSCIPCHPNAKHAPSYRPRAFFAGGLSVEKGVGDCLEAVAHLKACGQTLLFSFAGGGDQLEALKKTADDLGVADQVMWLGMVPNMEVRALMRDHDLVVVPSRHAYSEGLPNTIYEGLASRTPLIVSDHPAFTGRIPRDACRIFKAGDPADLAANVQSLLDDTALYESMSLAAEKAVDALYLGLEWDVLMTKWLSDPLDQSGWVHKYSLRGLGY